jgi:hypothetical protein
MRLKVTLSCGIIKNEIKNLTHISEEIKNLYTVDISKLYLKSKTHGVIVHDIYIFLSK